MAPLAAHSIQFNVANYTTVRVEQGEYRVALVFALSVCLSVVVAAARAAAADAERLTADPHHRPYGRSVRRLLLTVRNALSLLWPLLFGIPLVCRILTDVPPRFALSFLLILGVGWAAFRTAAHRSWEGLISPTGDRPESRSHAFAVLSLVLLTALLTVVHTVIQINFFEHFMYGHADIGHFTEELKNALTGRGLRSDSFDNTRLGWHFVPLMYVLVPGYALWQSPVYLMACGAVFVHLPALPAYYLARRLSGSAAIGWIWGLAWLLLPSQSRMIYANTYGFPWNNVTMLVLALMITAAMTHRWRTSLALVAVLLLCRETTAAAGLGWGLYVALFTPRRRTGVVIAVLSAAYFVLCASVLIPHFAEAGRYERLDVFGGLGSTVGGLVRTAVVHPGIILERLCRREVFYFVSMLLVPMALLPLRGWRMALAAIPAFVPIVLLENEEWLSIKFWHQATVLPFLFFAGIAAMKQRGGPDAALASTRSTRACSSDATTEARWWRVFAWFTGRRSPPLRTINFAAGAAVLVAAALGHYFYGFSPISKAYEVYTDTPFLHQPDPRLETVRRLRERIPRSRTILATERLAAHFTDYKRLYTGRRIRPADFVIIDRSDTWDTSGLPQKVAMFRDDATYRVYGEFGSLIVFAHRRDAR